MRPEAFAAIRFPQALTKRLFQNCLGFNFTQTVFEGRTISVSEEPRLRLHVFESSTNRREVDLLLREFHFGALSPSDKRTQKDTMQFCTLRVQQQVQTALVRCEKPLGDQSSKVRR